MRWTKPESAIWTWRWLQRGCAPARQGESSFRPRRDYSDRYQEFFQAGVLPLARAVAVAFKSGDGILSDGQLNSVLDSTGIEGWTLFEKQRFLRERGYVWQAEGDTWEPGIPSLMDYMISKTEPEIPDPARHQN